MKFQFLVEIDLKTLCHGRDENCDADVFSQREVAYIISEHLEFMLDDYIHRLPLTHVLGANNVNGGGTTIRWPAINQQQQPESNEL